MDDGVHSSEWLSDKFKLNNRIPSSDFNKIYKCVALSSLQTHRNSLLGSFYRLPI